MDIEENGNIENKQVNEHIQQQQNNESKSSSSEIQPEIKFNGKDNDLELQAQMQEGWGESIDGVSQLRQPVSNSEIIDRQPQFLPSIRSVPVLTLKQEKVKRKKVRAYVQDFTDYLPQSLLIINKTVIPPIVRTGQRYQASISRSPPLKSVYRPVGQWLVWRGSQKGESQPSAEQLGKFKELLGDNRTEQQFIHMRERLGLESWKEVLEQINRSRGEIRRIFHQAQRNRI